MIKSVKKFYLFIAFLVCLLTLTSCIVVDSYEVHLDNDHYELMVGQTVDAKAWVTKDANEEDVMIGYQSYDPSIATYADGKINAIKAGEVRIKAYVYDNPDIYTVATVVVVDDISQTVQFDYSEKMIVGEKQTIQYEFAVEDSRVLAFTSSNPTIATVDENGVVVAKSAGEVTLTTKVASLYQENSYKTYTLTIQVNYQTYPIVYELNGGTNHQDNPTEYATEQLPTQLLEPSKLGFAFMGWYDNPECNGEALTSIKEGTTGTVTLYAKWSTADYTIHYELNGGTNHQNNPEGYTIGSLPITLEEPTKAGYTFIGWYQGTEHIKEITKDTTGNLELEAKWRINNYQITYELNGGTNDTTNPNTYNVEKLPIELKNPTKTGYKFAGWMLNDKPITEISASTTGDLTLVATWEAVTYTVTFDVVGGVEVSPLTYTVETGLTLPTPTKVGYTFDGWYNNDNAKVETIAKGTTGDITLTAEWTAITYTITFDVVGGTTVANTTYTVEDELTLPTTSKVGYTFDGWYNNDNAKVETIAKGTTGDIELTAQWTVITYTITYDVAGGDEVDNPTNYTVETPTFALKAPTKIGHTFLGWYNGETKVEAIEIGTTDNLTLVAKWQINKYTVTFSDGVASQEVEYGKTATAPTNPTKEGYEFVAWQKDGVNFAFDTPITSDIQLVSSWNKITYTITYQLDGGTNATTNPTEYTIDTETFVLSIPTKEGYNFLGWFNGEAEVKEIAKGSTGNLALLAKWEIQTFTVTFSDGVVSQTVEYGATATAPENPVKIGSKFVSWQKDGVDFDFNTEIKEDITLTAKWELMFENGAKVVISTIRTSGNYFAIRSELTTSSTKRLVGTDLGTADLLEVAKKASADLMNVWTIEYDENAYYIKSFDGKYIAWSSGNSAKLSDTMYALMITVNEDGTYVISSVSDSTRKLQFNKDVNYNYFAFYTSEQIGKLLIQDYVEPTDEEKLQAAINAITVDSTVSTTIELAKTSLHETTVSWNSSNTGIILINEDGSTTIAQPETTTTVTLTATVTLPNGKSATKTFEVEVIGVPKYDHAGTAEDPYSVSDATKYAQQLSANAFGDSVVYVKGIVKSVSYSTSYNNYEIILVDSKDSTVEFKLYRAVKDDIIETPYQNDVITASGYIQNYNGNTPELAPNNNVNPSIVKVESGESNITFTYDDQIVTVTHSTTNTTNRLDRVFQISVIKDGYVIESVKTNSQILEAVDGTYTFVIEGDTEVVITAKENAGGTVQEKTYTYTFAKGALKTSGGTVDLNTVNWTYTSMTYAGFDTNSTNKGFQIGSGSNPTTSFTLSTNGITGKIKSIVVNASIASKGKAKLSISVGGTPYLTSQSLTTTATDYTITPNASGEIQISFENTAKAFYIKSITIIYEE